MLGGLSLSPFITGCSRKQTVAEPSGAEAIRLASHPAIATPSNGCYLGWHYDIGYRSSGANDYWLREKSAAAEKRILGGYKSRIGSLPAVHSFADDFLGDGYYPAGVLKAALNIGVYPMMRYMPRADWKHISEGNYDHHLQRFAQQVSKAAIPAFFIPFPGAGHPGPDHPWKEWKSEYFIPAWERMYQIFERQGANRYLVWGLHLAGKTSGIIKNRQNYLVPPERTDWVGISIWNQTITRSRPFMELLGDDYTELTARYTSKPFAIWELGDRHRGTDWFYRYSSKWFERTYEAIRKLPRCKMVVFYDFRNFDLDLENQLFKERNIEMMKNVGQKGYYLTGG